MTSNPDDRDRLVMGEPGEVELRCSECIDLGLECPLGYNVERCVCDVCGFRLQITYRGCHDDSDAPCPECGGTLDYIDDVEDDEDGDCYA